ncbi:hypothetical protein RclHR1_16360003 [Rhizophagus clarus]|uniref:Uncharacterized protein n=1 Tax=Rhizophagus clarus TaxID=94130 RepID=A0A2Z6QHH7_9GLOM|nr:hypothetical protein RclHR1_16360003 [Rhizophagus clarus]
MRGTHAPTGDISSNIGLFATLLDSRSKKLVHFSTTERQEATILLIKRYETYKLENKASTEEEKDDDDGEREVEKEDKNKLNDIDLDKSLIDSIFEEEENCEEENKVDEYLKLKPVRNIDPLS